MGKLTFDTHIFSEGLDVQRNRWTALENVNDTRVASGLFNCVGESVCTTNYGDNRESS